MNANGPLWSSSNMFAKILKRVEHRSLQQPDENKICPICKHTSKLQVVFQTAQYTWNSGMYHMIRKHSFKPQEKFIRHILDLDPSIKKKCTIPKDIASRRQYIPDKFTYVKIRANQLMILDALLEHGGIEPKYKNKQHRTLMYSEHAGMLNFKRNVLSDVIITGITYWNKNDPEIYFPSYSKKAYSHEYIFHTHPATPTPGGRVAGDGILYEMPSKHDILHFVYYFNTSKVQGSIIVTPEGLYNIRQHHSNNKLITCDANAVRNIERVKRASQQMAIQKFGTVFSTETFYSIIAQDTMAIDMVNAILEKHDIHIDFFPRQKISSGHWIIGTIYLPMCVHK
jgi:hypothetical protein